MSDTTKSQGEPEKKPGRTAKSKAAGTRVISRKDGLRRAGIAHTGDVTHPPGTFTVDQIKQLKAEPLLTVIEIEGEAGTGEA